MPRSKHIVLLSSILLVVSLFFAMTPVASTAFAATTGMHATSKASMLSTASSHLAPDSCPPTCAHPINKCPPSQQEGNSNDWVKIIKFALNQRVTGAGLDTANSVFTSATKSVVIQFQTAEVITGGGGVVGDRTWSALGFCRGFQPFLTSSIDMSLTSCPPDQSEESSGNNMIFVEAIQDLLNRDFDEGGLFSNTPDNFHPYLASDGQFGPDTHAAVVDFQDFEGISGGGGVVGQRTWSALGMCS